MEKVGSCQLPIARERGHERGLMERCNQSVSKAVTTRFFSAGIGHRTHQGSSEADRMGEQRRSFSPGTCYTADAVDRVIEWYAYKEGKKGGKRGRSRL